MSEFRRRLMQQKKGCSHNIVEYIKTRGNQYIELDYTPNRDTRIVFVFDSIKQQPIIDASKSGTESRLTVVSTGYSIFFASGNIQGGAPEIAVLRGRWNKIDINYYNDIISTDTESRTISALSTGYDMLAIDNCIPLHVFRREYLNQNALDASIASILIYERGKLLYDLKPFDDGDKNGLVNLLTDRIYTDANGDKFITLITE